MHVGKDDTQAPSAARGGTETISVAHPSEEDLGKGRGASEESPGGLQALYTHDLTAPREGHGSP